MTSYIVFIFLSLWLRLGNWFVLNGTELWLSFYISCIQFPINLVHKEESSLAYE